MNNNSNHKNAIIPTSYYKSTELKGIDNLNVLLNKYHINKNHFIILIKDDVYNRDNLINKENIYDLKCAICLNILNNPKSCSSNKNSHSFCKKCIDKYLKENNKYCPICKNYFFYKTNYNIEKQLIKALFNCNYYSKGCKKVLNYYNFFKHINECKYKTIEYECHVEKYNYNNKQFEKCLYTANNNEIEKHFKKCAFNQYKCIFCNENILGINLKEHTEKKCKIRIIYENGLKYIGEYKNNKKEGYGKMYYSEGNKYEGEWKNNEREGYGILFVNGNIYYEGDWKNNYSEGYGTIYFSNEMTYKGKIKKDKMEGYGKLFDKKNDIIYEGNWKNNKINGYGIIMVSGIIYAGEWLNNKRDGFGILSFDNEIQYIGEWKNNKVEGYGILYHKNKIIYRGEWKNNLREGYGIEYNNLKGKYKGRWKHNLKDGLGIEYNSDGCVEGRFENGEMKHVLSYSKYYSSKKGL